MASSPVEAEGPMFWEFPDVVIDRHLFPFLPVPDLIRLRRVCKKTKFLAESYLRQHPANKLPEIEITQGSDKSLSAFLSLDLPFTRFYINNTDMAFYQDPDIPEFLERYSDTLTHLKVRSFSALTDPEERSFFDSFKKLTHLELEEVDARAWRCDTDKDKKQFGRSSCPPIASSFYNLKTIKFGHIQTAHKFDHGYWEDILYCCYQHLQFIQHPEHDHPLPRRSIAIPVHLRNPNNPPPKIQNSGGFLPVYKLIEHRHENHPDAPNLQYYDMGNMSEMDVGYTNYVDFTLLSQLCTKRGVKLLNVNAGLYHLVEAGEHEAYNVMVAPLVSLKNLDNFLYLHELPNLEKLVITGTTHCTFAPWWDEAEGKPQWPRLKVLDMMINSRKLMEYGGRSMLVTDLFKFFFTEVIRLELTELALRFRDVGVPFPHVGRQLPCPKTREIKASCPYLKKVTLQNWGGTNKSLASFWEGLSGLEELVLLDCWHLGNVAFVGEDVERPTFFKLTRLKSLTLGGLEKMCKITDTLFELVLRHMKLTKLILTCRRPIRTVTAGGINALLRGDFAKTIEKFPFRDFALEGLSPEAFSELERQFRSYYMV